MQAISIQTTCVSLKFAYRRTSPIFREIGEIGGNLAINEYCFLNVGEFVEVSGHRKDAQP
jgi:hypothetical protein